MAKKIKKQAGDEQVNRKHRAKSRKLEKRVEAKKNKKSVRKEIFAKKDLIKHIRKAYKSARKEMNFNLAEYDLVKVKKYVNRLKQQIDGKIALFEEIEKLISTSGISDLSQIEDEKTRECIHKIFREMKFSQSVKQAGLFRLPKGFVFNDLEFFLESIFSYLDHTPTAAEEEEESEQEDDFDSMAARVGNNAEFINRSFYAILNEKQAEQFEEKVVKNIKADGKSFLASTLAALENKEDSEENELDALLECYYTVL